MSRWPYVLLITLILGLNSCTKDNETPTGNLKVVFTLNYDGLPIVFNQNSDYNGEFIRMTTFTYFVSNMKLRSAQDSVNLKDIDFVDFSASNTSLKGAKNGFSITIPKVKAGSYSTLEFGVGVHKALNATTPADYPSTSPLANTAYYWVPWTSYFFSKMEGKFDSTATGNFELGFMFHTGLDQNYKVIQLNRPINISSESTNTLHISLDVKKLFVLDGNPIDLNLINKAHWPMNKEVIISIINNYGTAFKLDN